MSRLPREERAERLRTTRHFSILLAAMAEAEERGLLGMTRAAIAQRAGVADGSVNHAFGSMDGLRQAVMMEAIATRRLAVLRQGIAANDPVALAAPAELRQAALAN